MARLKGGVQLDEVGVVQLVHHLDFIPHNILRDKQSKTGSRSKQTGMMQNLQSFNVFLLL